jgi:molybdenum cofactor cytidylyltransferase
MIALEDCAAVLLCAGLSQRFGPGNKLLAPLDGKPLVAHAAELCTQVPFARRIAVVPPAEQELSALLLEFGFDLVVNPRPEAGKDRSLRLGLGRALAPDVRGVLVLLGDMPHVDVAHLRALSVAADDEIAAISSAGDHLSPPTLIPAEIARRATAVLDRPVRASLGRPAEVTASPSMLADYDLPEQFDMAPELAQNAASRSAFEDR